MLQVRSIIHRSLSVTKKNMNISGSICRLSSFEPLRMIRKLLNACWDAYQKAVNSVMISFWKYSH